MARKKTYKSMLKEAEQYEKKLSKYKNGGTAGQNELLKELYRGKLQDAKEQQRIIDRDARNLAMAEELGVQDVQLPERGTIDYPSTDVRNKQSVNPNTAWMYGNLTNPELARSQQDFSNELIAGELAGLGVERLLGRMVQGAGKVDDVVESGLFGFGRKKKPAKPAGAPEGISMEEFAAKNLKDLDDPALVQVYNDFAERVYSPEGQKRLAAMQRKKYDPANVALKETLAEPAGNLAMLTKGEEAALKNYSYIHPDLPTEIRGMSLRHELEHGVQGKSPTNIDYDLANLDLVDQTKFDTFKEEMNLIRNLGLAVKDDVSTASSLAKDMPRSLKKDLGKASEYFKYQREGIERSPMLAELQQHLVDNKLISHPYATKEITPELIEKVRNQLGDDSALRILNISENTPKNNKLLAKNLNKLLTATGAAAGVGANAEEFKNGGSIKGEMTPMQMDSVFNANRDVPMVNRIFNPDPSLGMKDLMGEGTTSSHVMGSYGRYVAPQVVMNPDSTMRYVPQDRVGDEVIRKGNAIKLSSEDRAKYFAKNYKNTEAWKSYTKGMEEFKNGGMIKRRNLPEYGLGGDIFSGAASGAMTTAAIAPPWGAIGGAVIGGVSGFIGGKKKKEAEEEAKRQQQSAADRQLAFAQYDPTNQQQYSNMLEFKYGGMKKYAMGGVPNAELEGGESIETPQGANFNIQGPSHAQGGVEMALENGTRVYSDKLKKPGTSKTYSELNKKLTRSIKKHQDTLENPNATSIARKTSERMLNKLEGEQNDLFMDQERVAYKKGMRKNNPTMENGGLFDMQVEPWMTSLQAFNPVKFGTSPNLVAGTEYDDLLTGLEGGKNLDGKSGIGRVLGNLGESNIGPALSGIASLAPTLYNIGQGIFGEAEQTDPTSYQNTLGMAEATRLKSRKYDVSPELDAIRRSYSQGKRDVTSASRTRGELLSNLGGLTARRAGAESSVLAGKQNIENQYQSEAAQMLAGLGAQDVQTRLGISQTNAANRAAQRNMLGTGLSQLSQFTQNQQLMSNQRDRDARLEKLIPSLAQSFQYDREGNLKYKIG
jgi:hypothetical protein